MIKKLLKIIKIIIGLAIFAVLIVAIVFVFNFLMNGVTGQASKKCQEIVATNGGAGKEIAYSTLADWLKTQSTSIVSVTDAYYQNDSKKGDQIVVKYSLYKNIYSGKRVIDAETLKKYCGI